MRHAWLFASVLLLSGCAGSPADPTQDEAGGSSNAPADGPTPAADPLAEEHARDVTTFGNVTMRTNLSFEKDRYLLEATLTNEGSTNATIVAIDGCGGGITIAIVTPWGERQAPSASACAQTGPTALAPGASLRAGDHFGPTYRNGAGRIVETEPGEYLLAARAYVEGEPHGMRLQRSHRITWASPE